MTGITVTDATFDIDGGRGLDGRISYRFHARDLQLVMGRAPRDVLVRFRVLLDG